MDILGRYYTADLFSHLLIEKMSVTDPRTIMELGVGNGSLVKAALKRWINALYYVTDVDINSIKSIKKQYPFINSFHIDTVNGDLSKRLDIKYGSVDIALCNPPYLKLKNTNAYNSLFEDAKLDECIKLKLITTEIVFLAKNLQFLKENGELGIILPDSLITGKEFHNLRLALVKQHRIKSVIQLPENIFPKTEALTHILVIEKQKSKITRAPLFLANTQGKIIEQIEVDVDSLINRMDYKYHSWSKSRSIDSSAITLRTINACVKRGTLSHKELKESGDNYIHTTNIIDKKSNYCCKSAKFKNAKYLLSQTGDILLARVGCVGKLSKVLRGQAPISDCIYRIRVNKAYRDLVWDALTSSQGQKWLNAISHGVCAKVISKEDLLDFPLKY